MTAPAVEPLRSEMRLQFGTPNQFAGLRALLLAAEFTEAGVCERTGADSIYDFMSIKEGRQRKAITDARDVLVSLFLDAEVVDRVLMERYLGLDGVRVLDALGLLGSPPSQSDARFGTVLLYPTQGLWLVSDLPSSGAGATNPLPSDAVYPAITDNTRDYIAGIPSTPCKRFLEMCGGTGVAALIAAHLAPEEGRAWTADITERSTRFAEFNALLNDLPNFTAVQGDLYEPVRGLTFDRIVAHPPYVASPERTMIYRDGGPDGEQFTRAILAGLPEFLEPGGRFYLTCIATDRTNTPLEERIREMIGPTQAEYDVVVAVRVAHQPADYYLSLARAGKSSYADAEQRVARYGELDVVNLVYCSVVVARHAAPRAPFTARRPAGVARVGETLDWQLDWERLRESAGFTDRFLDTRIRCSEGLRVRTEQVLGSAGWHVGRCDVVTERPFRASVECTAETAAILMRCDGTMTIRDLARVLVGEGLLGADGAEKATASLVSFFVGAGCLESDAVPVIARGA